MDQLRDFLDYLRLNRNASPRTVEAYDSDLSQFLAYASGHHGKKHLEPGDLELATVRGFMADLHRKGQSRASVARKLSALRSFMRFMRREGYIDSDPAALAAAPKQPQPRKACAASRSAP